MDWHFMVKFCAKSSKQGEEERERKRVSECVGGRWGILAENRTLVIFSFRQFLCLALTFQVAAHMKDKYLCQSSWVADPSRWMPEIICIILFQMISFQSSNVGGSFSAVIQKTWELLHQHKGKEY